MDTELRLVPDAEEHSPTVTASDRLAAEIMEGINALAERIGGLEVPHPATASHVRGARTVSREFIESMIAFVEEQPELRNLGTFDVDEAHAVLQFNDAFRAVVDRLNVFAASVGYTMESRKAKVVFAALRTYVIAKGMARDPNGANLIPHLQNLRRDLGRKSAM